MVVRSTYVLKCLAISSETWIHVCCYGDNAEVRFIIIKYRHVHFTFSHQFALEQLIKCWVSQLGMWQKDLIYTNKSFFKHKISVIIDHSLNQYQQYKVSRYTKFILVSILSCKNMQDLRLSLLRHSTCAIKKEETDITGYK